jgi:opacity protein-like surface antigen
MKKTLLTLLAAAVLSSAAYAQATPPAEPEDNSIGLSLALDDWSNYLWRGTYWFNDSGAFFPLATYDVMKSGLKLNVGYELSEKYILDGTKDSTQVLKDRQSLDLGVAYSYTFADMIIADASVWYYHMADKLNTYGSAAFALTYKSMLNPKVTYTHDYYVDSEKKSDFYLQFGIGNEYEMTKEVKLAYSLAGGYYNADSVDLAGISDITLTVKPSIALGSTSIYSAFNAIYVPSKDFYMNGTVEDKLRFYAMFGAAYSL